MYCKFVMEVVELKAATLYCLRCPCASSSCQIWLWHYHCEASRGLLLGCNLSTPGCRATHTWWYRICILMLACWNTAWKTVHWAWPILSSPSQYSSNVSSSSTYMCVVKLQRVRASWGTADQARVQVLTMQKYNTYRSKYLRTTTDTHQVSCLHTQQSLIRSLRCHQSLVRKKK